MKPILFDANCAQSGHGFGNLSDVISCHVIEELNSRFDLEMKYPVDGIHYSDLALRRVIKAPRRPGGALQPFRIYRITTPINGVVSVYAHHIAYDLDGIPAVPFSASGVSAALQGLKTNAAVTCGFTLWTNSAATGTFTVSAPAPIWGLLGASTGGILDVFGGEYEFDDTTIKLWQQRGQNRGVKIRYGVNLSTLEQDANCANVRTGVLPYWSDTDSMVTGSVVNATGTFDYTSILPVDFSADFSAAPTAAQLTTAAQAYIAKNRIGVPEVSLKVSYVQLSQAAEYQGRPINDEVDLGDTVSVSFEKLGISTQARAVALDYDVVLEKIDNVTFGSAKPNLPRTIAAQTRQIKKTVTATEAVRLGKTLTQILLGAKGGAVRLLDNDNNGYPDELYIGNNADPAQATKVWRFNYEGFGGGTSFNGPFTIGMYFAADGTPTIDCTKLNVENIKAGNINSGTISADRIGAHSLNVSKLSGTISNNNWELDFDAGTFTIGTITANMISSNVNYLDHLYCRSTVTPSIVMDDNRGTATLGPDGVYVWENGSIVLHPWSNIPT